MSAALPNSAHPGVLGLSKSTANAPIPSGFFYSPEMWPGRAAIAHTFSSWPQFLERPAELMIPKSNRNWAISTLIPWSACSPEVLIKGAGKKRPWLGETIEGNPPGMPMLCGPFLKANADGCHFCSVRRPLLRADNDLTRTSVSFFHGWEKSIYARNGSFEAVKMPVIAAAGQTWPPPPGTRYLALRLPASGDSNPPFECAGGMLLNEEGRIAFVPKDQIQDAICLWKPGEAAVTVISAAVPLSDAARLFACLKSGAAAGHSATRRRPCSISSRHEANARRKSAASAVAARNASRPAAPEADEDPAPLEKFITGGRNLELQAVNKSGIIAAVERVQRNGVDYDYPVVLLPVRVHDERVNHDLAMAKPAAIFRAPGTAGHVRDEAVIGEGGLAGIAAHQPGADRNRSGSDPGDAPSMPKLNVCIPGVGDDALHARWRLRVHYDRGNGRRSARNLQEDTVLIPPAADGESQWTRRISVTGEWRPHEEEGWKEEIKQRGFFGGAAEVYCWIDGQDEPREPFIRFTIGGLNPDDRRCRHYIDQQAPLAAAARVAATNQTLLRDPIETGTGLWFGYAVAKSESKGYNDRELVRNTRYNQFWEVSAYQGKPQTPGQPIWGNDGAALPGGYGMFQVTGTPLVPNDQDNIPRREIWNWQDNVRAGLKILAYKKYGPVESAHAVLWLRRQKNASNANGVALPDHRAGRVFFSDAPGSRATMEDALAIKAFNGASHPPANIDRGIEPGFVADCSVSGHYCYWNKTASSWALSRFNSPGGINPFNYVDRVCAEVEVPAPRTHSWTPDS